MGSANVRASRYGIRSCPGGYSSTHAGAGAGAGLLRLDLQGPSSHPPKTTKPLRTPLIILVVRIRATWRPDASAVRQSGDRTVGVETTLPHSQCGLHTAILAFQWSTESSSLTAPSIARRCAGPAFNNSFLKTRNLEIGIIMMMPIVCGLAVCELSVLASVPTGQTAAPRPAQRTLLTLC